MKTSTKEIRIVIIQKNSHGLSKEELYAKFVTVIASMK